MSRVRQTLCTVLLAVLPLSGALAEETAFTYDHERPRFHVGLGAAFILGYAHAEFRAYPFPWLSADAFVSAGYGTLELTIRESSASTSFVIANSGVETRAHLYLGRIIDLHAGLGVSVLTMLGEPDASAFQPIAYVNLGTTVAVAPRARLDLEVNPFVSLAAQASAAPFTEVALLPVVRLRFVL